RGDTEVVQLVYPLQRLNAEDFASEVQKMLTQNFGKVIVLPSSNQLILQDKVDMLKQVDHTIRKIEEIQGPGESVTLTHKCKYIKADFAAQVLKEHLGDEKQEVVIKSASKDGPVTRTKVRVHKITMDENTNSVLVTGPADKIGKAKSILEKTDVPQFPGDPGLAIGPPFLKM